MTDVNQEPVAGSEQPQTLRMSKIDLMKAIVNIYVEFDPNDMYRERPLGMDTLGLIPFWVFEWNNVDDADMTLKDYLDKRYGYGLYEMDKSTISSKGVYSYPDDPDLYPIAKMDTRAGVFYQYDYGIVAIPTEDGHFVTRMD